MTAEPRFVSISHFMKEMLGYSSRLTYYKHVDKPGWPQRFYPLGPGTKPRLRYDDCVAFIDAHMPARKTPPPDGRKRRRIGRPVKAPSAPRPVGGAPATPEGEH